MMGKAHAAVGAFAGASAALMTGAAGGGSGPVAFGACIGGIASLLPDIDVKDSIGRKMIKYVVVFLNVAAGVCLASYFVPRVPWEEFGTIRWIRVWICHGGWFALLLGWCFVAALICSSHRGFSHSFVACAWCVAVAILAGGFSCGRAALFGYASHLFIDLFNRKGEQLLFPWSGRYCFKLFPASGTANTVTMFLGYGATVVILAISFVR